MALALVAVGILALLVAAAVFGPMLLGSGPDERSVPTVLNMTKAEAEKALEDQGLKLGEIDREASEDVPKGRVVSQDPEPGEFLPAGDPVDVLISTGQPDVVMPDVLGDDKDDAKDELEELGLKVKLVEAESDADADVVIDSDPRPATSISVGTRVTVVYSDGPEEVPSVVGLMQSRATSSSRTPGSTSTSTSTPRPAPSGARCSPRPRRRSRRSRRGPP